MSAIPTPKSGFIDDDAIKLALWSIKANQDFSKVKKEFNLCRSQIEGRYVNPEVCVEYSKNVINSLQAIKNIDTPECNSAFEKAYQCLKSPSSISFGSKCEDEINSYMQCDKPAPKQKNCLLNYQIQRKGIYDIYVDLACSIHPVPRYLIYYKNELQSMKSQGINCATST